MRVKSKYPYFAMKISLLLSEECIRGIKGSITNNSAQHEEHGYAQNKINHYAFQYLF